MTLSGATDWKFTALLREKNSAVGALEEEEARNRPQSFPGCRYGFRQRLFYFDWFVMKPDSLRRRGIVVDGFTGQPVELASGCGEGRGSKAAEYLACGWFPCRILLFHACRYQCTA